MGHKKLGRGASPYRGVTVSRIHGIVAKVFIDGASVSLGRWATEREAAIARDRGVLHYGLELPLNLPETSRSLGPASPIELRRLARSRRSRKEQSSAYIGVRRAREGEAWIAGFSLNRKQRSLGRLPTQKLAALWHDRAVVYYRGSGVLRNFPDQDVAPASMEELRAESRRLNRERGGTRGVRVSQYHGVVARNGRFSAVVYIGGRSVRAGTYLTEREAAIARDRAVLHTGSGDELNFPAEARRHGPAAPIELRRLALARARRKKGESSYVGVHWVSEERKWLAKVGIDGVGRTLGFYERAKDAALSRERVVAYYADPLLMRNFPELKVDPISFEGLRAERRREHKKTASSRCFGVFLNEGERPWAAVWSAVGDLGQWDTEREAAEAFDRALRYYGGPTHLLNFPERELPPADVATLRAEARKRYKERTTSRFHGVHWRKDLAAWAAQIRHGSTFERLGCFRTQEEAARAYDRRAPEVHGDNARLNFHPETGEEICGGRRLRHLEGVEAKPKKSRSRTP
jgi:hypothetical protein